ncbi:MAG: hypothetical protein R2780_01635 [Crocinitomicaceae bacterium]|nr:hypothetical protein [Crocinitomicaceae bacterium]
MKTPTFALLIGLICSPIFALTQTDTVDAKFLYDRALEDFMKGEWFRNVAVYEDEKIDTNYKRYEFFEDGRIHMTEVKYGKVHFYNYGTYFVRDSVLYLRTHYRDTSMITDAVTFQHLDSANFVIKSIFPGMQYHKTTFGIKENKRGIPPETPIKEDEELEMPGFAEKKPIVFT